jgi:CheY-like chemotaxis protein
MFTEECAFAGGVHDDEAGRDGPCRSGPDAAVLIVEDERIARRALSSLLAASGYVTEAAGSAEEALALLNLKGETPKVILVDLNLPGMNGLDFIRRVGQRNPAVLAVLMTGAGEETLRAALEEYRQPVPCLRKPLDFNRLLSLISEVRPSSPWSSSGGSRNGADDQ